MNALMRWLRGAQVCRIPILGIDAAGKSCFAWGLGQRLVARENDWGGPRDDCAGYFHEIDRYMLAGQPLVATMGKRALTFELRRLGLAADSDEAQRLRELQATHELSEVTRVSEVDEELRLQFKPVIELSTHDISGGDFRQLGDVFARPEENPRSDPAVQGFISLLRGASGLLVVLDLARQITEASVFKAMSDSQWQTHITQALAAQVTPLCMGVREALQVNSFAGKSIFFVVTKSDIHGLSARTVENMVQGSYATLMERLRRGGVRTRFYCTAYEGLRLGSNTRYEVKGIDSLLQDLVLCYLATNAPLAKR